LREEKSGNPVRDLEPLLMHQNRYQSESTSFSQNFFSAVIAANQGDQIWRFFAHLCDHLLLRSFFENDKSSPHFWLLFSTIKIKH
jgi:hypothetical protein